MSIQIGVYDFFSYTIPGVLYLASAFFFTRIFGVDYGSVDLSSVPTVIVYAVGAALTAYILGIIMDPIVNKTWFRLFQIDDFNARIEKNYWSDEYPVRTGFDIQFAYVLYSLIKKEYPDAKNDIEKFKVNSIMLRNISFGLFLFAIDLLVMLCVQGFVWYVLVLSILLIIFAVVAGYQSVEFNIWFFSGIYQASVSEVFDIETLFPKGQPYTHDEVEDDDDEDED
jgi:hypothetical protein